ncbi:Unknown protein [Striga hermonthica]|uniref:Uncharacterized protein n=1 Tax=Striga hermonthica TaxID=68872 RepID=A0A9N7NTB2_STRHE|nr:Unknown protein [Striga hermonthica]
MEADQGCTTPEHPEYRIPAPLLPPATPRKKKVRAEKRDPPENDYLKSPEVEAFLAGLEAHWRHVRYRKTAVRAYKINSIYPTSHTIEYSAA